MKQKEKDNIIKYFFIYFIYAFIILSSIFQLYFIHIGKSYISLTAISILLLIPFLFVNWQLLIWKPLFAVSLILIFQIISLLWSIDIKAGFSFILRFVLFILVVIITYILARKNHKIFIYILEIYFLLLLLEVFLVIYFRLHPMIKLGFLHTKIAEIFINPNVIEGLWSGEKNNIFDPNKSGGFFINANVAAAFLGINTFISYGLSKAYSIKWLNIITLLLVIGILFTGSKAGLILIVLLTLFLNLVYNMGSHLTMQKVLITLFFIILLYLTFLFSYNYILNNYFAKEVTNTTEIRFLIWDCALKQFLNSPLIGLGFGGWHEIFSQYAMSKGISAGYPPHNTLIYLWAQSGIFVVILAIFFMIYVIKFGFRLIKSNVKELKGLGIAVLGAYLWTFIHGMGTNFGLVGELHMEVILAAILGYSYARYKDYILKLKKVV